MLDKLLTITQSITTIPEEEDVLDNTNLPEFGAGFGLLLLIIFILIGFKLNPGKIISNKARENYQLAKKQTIDSLEEIKNQQALLLVKFDQLQKLEESKKQKINEIVENAGKEIVKVLEETEENQDIRVIVKRIQDKW